VCSVDRLTATDTLMIPFSFASFSGMLNFVSGLFPGAGGRPKAIDQGIVSPSIPL
jgi:hypothetical protein